MIFCGVDIDRVSLNDLLVMDGGDDVDPGCLNDAVARILFEYPSVRYGWA